MQTEKYGIYCFEHDVWLERQGKHTRPQDNQVFSFGTQGEAKAKLHNMVTKEQTDGLDWDVRGFPGSKVIKQYGIYNKQSEFFVWDYWGNVFVFDNLPMVEAQLRACWEIQRSTLVSDGQEMDEILEVRKFLDNEFLDNER